MSSIVDSIQSADPAVKVLAGVGAIILATAFLEFLGQVNRQFIRSGKNLKKYGKYAVITGATDGIGKAYAMALAKKGMSIVLISRTEAKLVAVKEEIDAKNYADVDVKYIVCDYSKFDDKAKAAVKAGLDGLDIGVLINNVGVSYRYPRFFHEITDEEVINLTEMNVNSTVWMTRFVLPQMLEKKKGAIVNISSGSAMYTLPLLAQYSAAKSFIEKFTLALHAEYSSKGVSVQCQIPFYVSTKLAKMRKSFTVPTPDQFAKLGCKFIGHDDPVVSPYWVHAVMGYFMDRLPSFIVTKGIMSMHLGIRKRGLKKDAKNAKSE
ncbi:short-chain dehydrogenase/reductase acting with NAD or NADP as acceptor [Chaetoceros tenuissimus]|jgi:17beta-estradiol 17-dehydrogenase / very-long-chain 3-oxoacyl-CoA reductase|uniref:Short-chain dehydrogenase/reductase acting with NAD or NADP as acceptor n=1 Tax=Chaetoceros tenuissimus TaxID=426638 RepID=A0AAD3CXQ6_9STRA|nr:short-chain dehydrogenase/reductase acting with NAD or NADP as acceptor [Chaetoceros tenuissimus]